MCMHTYMPFKSETIEEECWHKQTIYNTAFHTAITELGSVCGRASYQHRRCGSEGVDMCHVGFSSITTFRRLQPSESQS